MSTFGGFAQSGSIMIVLLLLVTAEVLRRTVKGVVWNSDRCGQESLAYADWARKHALNREVSD